MTLLEPILVLAILLGLGYWFRDYFKPLGQMFRRWQTLLQALRQGNGKQGPSGPRKVRVVDVSAARRSSKTVCPVCGDDLSEAQVQALRERSLRCPGANRVGRECPFYGERVVN